MLDEADEMLSMGFKKELDEILKHAKKAENKWLFSATIPEGIEQIVKKHLSKDAIHIKVGGKDVVNQKIQHQFLVCDEKDKFYYNANLSLYGGLNFDDIESTEIKIRGRGNSTWYYGSGLGKKPYQIEFLEQQEVLGMPSDRRWVLLAENSDKSLIRNNIAFYMSSLSHLEYTPKGKYIDLYFNGSPMGTYLLAQKAEVTNNRLDIGPTGYLLEMTQGGRLKETDVRYESSIMKDLIGGAAYDLVFTVKHPLIQSGGTEYQELKNHLLFSSIFHQFNIYYIYIIISIFILIYYYGRL